LIIVLIKPLPSTPKFDNSLVILGDKVNINPKVY